MRFEWAGRRERTATTGFVFFRPPNTYKIERGREAEARLGMRERELKSVYVEYGNAKGVTCPSTGV